MGFRHQIVTEEEARRAARAIIDAAPLLPGGQRKLTGAVAAERKLTAAGMAALLARVEKLETAVARLEARRGAEAAYMREYRKRKREESANGPARPSA